MWEIHCFQRIKDRYGLTIVDADLIAREVVYPNKPAFNKIVAAFGDEVPNLINEDGNLNKSSFGTRQCLEIKEKVSNTKLNCTPCCQVGDI